MILSRKIRLYPTKEQEQLMWKHIGASRFIYNYMLELQKNRYQNGEKHLSEFDMNRLLTPLKKSEDFAWLNDISIITLQRSCRNLSNSYSAFFNKRANCPVYKSKKRSRNSFFTDSQRLTFVKAKNSRKTVNISKIGRVKFKSDYELPYGFGLPKNTFSNPVVSNVNGKWMLSFGVEVENQNLELTENLMGVDLGLKEAATVAYNNDCITFHNINKSRKMRLLNKRLKSLRKSISRKYESNRVGKKYVKTKNIEKCEKELRKLYAKISNIRNNYIHQSTKQLIMMRPKRIVIEDLNVSGILKNRHLSKAVHEACFYEWRRQFEYKCRFYGIELVVADRFYPSSKTCHCCGFIKKDLKLSDRTFVCHNCNFVSDRDFNAALNLSTYCL